MTRLLLFSFSLFLLNSCYINSKLGQDVTAKLIISKQPEIERNTNTPKYIQSNTSAGYLNIIDSEVTEQLNDNNVKIQTDTSHTAEYIIEIKKITITESTTKETIYDANSPYNGQALDIQSCGVNIEVTVTIDINKEVIFSKEIYSSKDESYTNRRTFWEVIFHQNKDNTEYHLKELNTSVFDHLCSKEARKISAAATHAIKKATR